MKTVNVVQDAKAPVPIEVMAESVRAISQGVKKLLAGPLSDKAIVLLIQNAAPSVGRYPTRKIGTVEVRAVLEGIESLERVYLKPKKKV